MSAHDDVTRDARWFRWLEDIDPATGQVRQQVYAHAVARGDHAQARMLIQQFEHARATDTFGFRRQYAPRESKPVYTRPQILKFHEAHRRGLIAGPEWDRLERDIIAAGREGRIANACPLAKNFGDGR
jgi:hypothetical protein